MPAERFWSGRTVLVTGCSGFLGLWLSRRLCDSDARVIGFCRNGIPDSALASEFQLRERLTMVRGNVADHAALEHTIREFGVDTIFHLAARSRVEDALQVPRETFEANVRGTWNLLDAVRSSGMAVRVVIASSDQINGDTLSPYAASKACAELLGRSYFSAFGVMASIARTSNLYGPGDFSFQRIIPGTIRAVIEGDRPIINGNGLAERDYLYVEDAVRGYLLLAQAMDDPAICGGIFSFTSGKRIRVATVVETILKVMQRTDLIPVVLGRAAKEVPSGSSLSQQTAESMPAWSPLESLESGLKKTIEWYRAHHDVLRLEDHR